MIDHIKTELRKATVLHASYERAVTELQELIDLTRGSEGTVVPLVGPTRCGKTEAIRQIKSAQEVVRSGPGCLVPTSDFGLGSIPPKPNDRDLYAAMLRAIGLGAGGRERTSLLRDRLIRSIHDQGIKVIALDEASHCMERGANLSERGAADHFKTVIDASGITLILSGLPKLQKLIDGNEQLRDRSLKSVSLLPYPWSSEDGRSGFNGAYQAAAGIVQDAGGHIALDDDEAVRRMYGASGGRVGVMFRILTASVSASKNGSLTFANLRKGAQSTVQSDMSPGSFFEEEQPSDRALVRSYVKVMQDAGLDVETTSIHDLAALKVPA